MNTKIKHYVNELLGKKPNPIILEIGSHYGEDTKDMLDVFDSPTIYCFEPHPGNAAFMRKSFKDNENVHIYEIALSDFNQQTTFNVLVSPLGDKPVPEKYAWIDEKDYRDFGLNDSGGCSLKKGYRDEECRQIVVQSLRLDRWNKRVNLQHVDFIWMDVQGAEREVVKGGTDVFSITKYVWTEFGETFYDGGMDKNETIDLFQSISFYPIAGDRNNLLLENRNDRTK